MWQPVSERNSRLATVSSEATLHAKEETSAEILFM